MNRFKVWLRRQSHIPVVLIGAAVILLLFFNDETSIARSRQYDEQITALNAEIQQCKDSAAYYRQATLDLRTDAEDLERVASESYNMQRPGEDVYIVQ